MNIFNQKLPSMNPQDLGAMVWMSQFTSPADRTIMLDDNLATFYNQQPAIDDITQQTHTMDMNAPMSGLIGDYSGHVTAIPPGAELTQEAQDLYNLQQLQLQQQLGLNNYNFIDSSMGDNSNQDQDEDELDQDDDGTMQYQEDGSFQMVDAAGNFMAIDQENFMNYKIMNDAQLLQPQSHFLDYGPNDLVKSNMPGAQTPLQQNIQHSQQTAPQKFVSKKIKPIKRPGLVLKTPIAYQGNIDPSVIPIQRDGMAVCEKCGAIGVKHSFYTRQRRFCSMACARGFEQIRLYQQGNNAKGGAEEVFIKEEAEQEVEKQHLQQLNYKFKMSGNGHMIKAESSPPALSVYEHDIMPQGEIPQIPKLDRLPSPCLQDERIITIRRKPNEFLNSFDWTPALSDSQFCAAPVTCFRHAPGYEMWPNVVVGMKVEVENTDCDSSQQLLVGNTPHSFWVATVLRIAGYKALLRYEGFDLDGSKDFWVNLCSSEVHPVGWCATRGKPLIPPKSITKPYKDWKEFLVSRLSNARTLPSTFYNKISDSFKSRFRVNLNLEVVDKNRISQVKLATIHKIVGKRLYVRYFDSPPEDNGFWCHEDSPLIHPVGWATTVGHNLAAPEDYLDRMNAARDQILEPNDDDATMDLFKTNFQFEEYYLEGRQTGFQEGMKLEAIDPLNLSSICVATVMSVLKFGYIMIRIDSYDPDINGADWFCYHEKSPCIFPVGFCQTNSIALTPPKGYDSISFTWEKYLIDTQSVAATEDLFFRTQMRQKFMVGMKLESADLMDPRLICVATISRVVGRLLKVHFDGWDEEYDQWLDSESPDIYPIGWCVLVGHKLEGPRVLPKHQPAPKISPKMFKKKGGRKKKIKVESEEELVPAPLTRTATIKKELENFEMQKQMTTSLPYSLAQLQSNLDQIQYTSNMITVKSEPTSSLGPIFDKGDDDEEDECMDDEDGEEEETEEIDYSDSIDNSNKVIPRLIDSSNSSPESSNGTGGGSGNGLGSSINPTLWDINDVASFLQINDCQVHCDPFIQNNIDGSRLLQMSKDEIVTLLNMKVGPSLKIYDLIQQLKNKMDPTQQRLLKANKKFL